MKVLLGWVLSYRLGQLKYLAIKTYLEAGAQLHKAITVLFGVIFLIAMTMSGLLLVLVGAMMLVPSSVEARGVFLLSTGALMLLLGVIGYGTLNSEKRWIKMMRIEDMVKEPSKHTRGSIQI